jgi:hypothetical protein
MPVLRLGEGTLCARCWHDDAVASALSIVTGAANAAVPCHAGYLALAAALALPLARVPVRARAQ